MELSRKFSKRRYFKSTIGYFLTCCMFFNTSLSVVLAGPEGAQVVNGQVSFQQSGYNTTITASDKSIINYSSFDIARPEIVQFIQPGSSASVLNRILSANPTNINGTLLANGRVFFVNPAGVYFGAGARVNVNQLVASGLNITNSDFINGQYNFAGGNGSVINSGDISAEKVYLIGRQVANSGSISCPAGYVVMASGDRVFLGEPGTDVVLEVDAPSSPESAEPIEGSGVLNEGTVDAASGTIVLAAGDIYSQAISNTGSLSASFESGEAGQITLTADGGQVTNTGTIEASGIKGGQVVMEGARVGQFGTVHADGIDSDGGSVDLLASDVVALSSDSLTTANAGTNGDGGEVIVYSPDTALFRDGAKIEVKGGSESGNGGFVEISGKKYVEVDGIADRTAANGESGMLLIDPANISITDNNVNHTTWTGDDFAPTNPAGSPSQIDIDTLETHLDSGNTTITTTWDDQGDPDNNPDPGEAGNVTFDAGRDLKDGVSGGSDNSLTINADGSIIFMANSGIAFTGSGDVTLNVGSSSSVDFNANITLSGGTLSGNATTVNVQSNDAEIQDAIDIAHATNGAAITVFGPTTKDTYTENVIVDKPDITLKSDPGDDVTLTANSGIVVDVRSGGDGFTLGGAEGEGFTINSGGGAVRLIQLTNAPQDVGISWNEFNTTGSASMGINVGAAGSDGLTITDNIFTADVGDGGIWGVISSDLTITDNTFNDPAGDLGSGYAIMFAGVTGTSQISRNTITGWGQGISIFHGEGVDGLTIAENVITGGTNGIRFGEYKQSAGPDGDITDVTVRNNTLTGNDIGIRLNPTGDHVLAHNIHVYENDLSGNTSYGVKNELTNDTVLDASGNWWGTNDAAGVADEVSANVDYTPWLHDADQSGDPGFQGDFSHLHVDDDSPQTGTIGRINEAIGLLNTNGTINVLSGDYTPEDVAIDRDLTLIVPSGTATMTSLSSNSSTTTGLSGNFTANSFLFAGGVTLAGHTSLSIGTGTGNIDFQHTLDGSTDFTENLTLTAGTGNISFGNDGTDFVGKTRALGDVLINSAADVTAEAAFTAKSLEQDIGTGTTWFKSTITTKGAGNQPGDKVDIQIAGDIQIDDKVDATGGTASSPGQDGGDVTLSGNNITVDEIDTSGTNASGPGDEAGGAGGNIQITSTTKTTLNDNLTAAGGSGYGAGSDGAGGNITLNGTTEYTAPIAVSTGTTTGNISFTGTLDNDIAFADSLGLTAGTGNIDFDSAVGNNNQLGAVTINSAQNVTVDNVFKAASLVQSAGTLTTLHDNVDTSAVAGVNIKATNIVLDGLTITTAGTGIAKFDGATDLTTAKADIDAGGTITFTGALTSTGAQDLELESDANIDFDDTVGFGAGKELGAVTINSAQNVEADNTIEAASLVQAAGTGTTTLHNNVTTTAAEGLDITNNAVVLDGLNVVTTNSGIVRFNGPTDLTTAATDIDAAGTITFANTLTSSGGSGLGLTLESDANIDFDNTLGAGANNELGAVLINTAQNVEADSTIEAASLVQAAGTGITTLHDDVTAAVHIELNSNTTVADGKTLKAGNDLKMGAGKILTGEGDLTLIATAGGITEVGGGAVDITMSNNDKTLRLTQNDALDMVTNFAVTNDENTDLIAEITGGTFSNTNADQWKSNQVKASGNITLEGSEVARDIVIGTAAWTDSGSNTLQGVVNSTGGGVSIISNSRGIYDADSYNYTTKVGTSLDNVTITGTSNGTTGVPLPAGSGKAAIVIKSKEDLKLGLNCILTANGNYSTPDERDQVVFKNIGADSGDPIDVAIYLASTNDTEHNGNIELGSGTVLIDNGPAGIDIGTLVVDAYDTVTFTPAFENSLKVSGSSDVKRIEVVSRFSETLEMARDRLPHADNPDNLADGEFVLSGGVYALRGTPDGYILSLAQILKSTQPVPLVLPKPLEPEDQGQVEIERRDVEVLGLGDKPELARAYPPSLNTDLNLDKAAQILFVLMPILRDSSRIATLDRIVVEIWQDVDQPIAPEQEAMIAQRISGTPAEEWVAALTEYVDVMSTMVGRSKTASVLWVMQTYVIPQAEEGLIQDQTVAFLEAQID